MCAIQHAQHAHGQQFTWQALNITTPRYLTWFDASIQKKNLFDFVGECVSPTCHWTSAQPGVINHGLPCRNNDENGPQISLPWRGKVPLSTALVRRDGRPTNSCHISFRELCFCRDYPGYSPGLEPTQSQINNPTRSQSNTRGAGVVEEGAVEVQILQEVIRDND